MVLISIKCPDDLIVLEHTNHVFHGHNGNYNTTWKAILNWLKTVESNDSLFQLQYSGGIRNVSAFVPPLNPGSSPSVYSTQLYLTAKSTNVIRVDNFTDAKTRQALQSSRFSDKSAEISTVHDRYRHGEINC